MAEANIPQEDLADVNKNEQHRNTVAENQTDITTECNVEKDNTDHGQRNHNNAKENSTENQSIGDVPAEKPIVYRNYGTVVMRPLALRKQYWSTKDIKERFQQTAKGSDVVHKNIGLSHSKNYTIGENLFKRQDIHAAPTRSPGINTNLDVHVEPRKNYSTRSDIADDSIRQGIGNHYSVTENSDINQGIDDTVLGNSSVDHNKDIVTKLDHCQTVEESTEIDQRSYNAEGEYTNENKSISEIQAENVHVNHKNDEADSYGTEDNIGPCPDLYISAEENLNENEGVSDDPAKNANSNDNDEGVRDNDEVVRENQGDNHNNNEAEESRNDNEHNHNVAAENQNGDEINEDALSGPSSQVDPQNEETDKGKKTDDTTENKTEKEAWTQEDIQALLRKAINLHASMKDLRTVIGCGGDVNKPIKSGLYPLHYAAYTDYPECIELLLNSGANVNVTDDIGYTPLHLAARRGNHRSMEVLIENGAIINYCDPGVVIHQTDEKNKLGYTTMEPINLAVQNCHPKCARLLLEKGARPNNKYFMGYEICLAPLDNPECMELLLEFGADPNVFNRCGLSPLMKACKDHHIEAVRKLIKYGADVNAVCPPLFEQKSVLQFAITSGNIVIINILLGKGAKIARQGEYKYSALHTAVMKGRADICRLMLQHGADPNERTDEGATPIMFACSTPELKERREIVQLLLDCGADINAHSPGYSYFDPYLAPLTEYFKCIANTEGFSIVKLMIRNGAIIHFSSCGLDMELKRLRDPFSIVPYVQCLQNNQEMFDFVVSAATKYNPLIIYTNGNIPEGMKDWLIYTATRPRELKHLVRVSLRSQLTPRLPDKVQELPLPPLLKSYLLYR
ncbi:uncharacterized protein LOC123563552 [Mercenaria mercenaria]|uniref:uncharacterized protein LOC123563552 n=1 Tax=Mercenaria mercenaria TaxID=6596 RepID=UPI00234F6DD9|nr:uncharacterized protein LOC123563552 [Mercenaria mercenaria]